MSRTSRLAGAIAIGALIGVGYTASPLTIWFLLWTAGSLWWVSRGLGGRERRLVLAVFALALAVRVAAVAILFLSTNHDQVVSFFWDGDGVYLKQRALAIRNVWLGVPLAPAGDRSFAKTFYRGYGWTSYLYVSAYLQWLVGPSPFGIHLFNIALYTTGTAALYRLVRSSFGAVAAAAGLVVVSFLPTLVAWSSAALKESFYFALGALSIVAAVRMLRAPSWQRRAASAVALVLLIVAIGTVREGGLLIAGAGVGGGLVAASLARRPVLLAIALALLPVVAWQAWQRPAVRDRVIAEMKLAAVRHKGNVNTEGHSYKLLDQRFYSTDLQVERMTIPEAFRFTLRAGAAFLLVPRPWDPISRVEVAFLAEQTIWYTMIVLACVGLYAGLARDPLLTLVLASVSAVASGVIALNSGNIGTMVRFRDTVVPFVVWLSALGGVAVVRCIADRGPGRLASGADRLALGPRIAGGAAS